MCLSCLSVASLSTYSRQIPPTRSMSEITEQLSSTRVMVGFCCWFFLGFFFLNVVICKAHSPVPYHCFIFSNCSQVIADTTWLFKCPFMPNVTSNVKIKCALMLGLGQRFFLYRVFFKKALKDHLCSKLFLPLRHCTSVQCIPTQQG